LYCIPSCLLPSLALWFVILDKVDVRVRGDQRLRRPQGFLLKSCEATLPSRSMGFQHLQQGIVSEVHADI
jgi:hypothetical protein